MDSLIVALINPNKYELDSYEGRLKLHRDYIQAVCEYTEQNQLHMLDFCKNLSEEDLDKCAIFMIMAVKREFYEDVYRVIHPDKKASLSNAICEACGIDEEGNQWSRPEWEFDYIKIYDEFYEYIKSRTH